MRCNFDRGTAWIWLASLGKPNLELRSLLFREYGTLEAIWEASCHKESAESFRLHSKWRERFEDDALRTRARIIREQTAQLGMSLCTPDDPLYPPYLKEIYAYPCVLYYYGKLPAQVSPTMRLLSAVGSRSCTPYGRSCAAQFGSKLAAAGLGIVSGMARGIDGEVHKSVLRTGGYTIAVLACGADMVYPPEHRYLYERIREKGCVLSELPPGTIPDKRNFPARNRIIAGLGEGTLIIEARKQSGAMITVDQAISNNRTVYAIPGNILQPASQGCNDLIRQGAQCVTSPEEILEDMGYSIHNSAGESGRIPELSKEELEILRILQNGPIWPDQIAERTKLPANTVYASLTLLEIKGFLRKSPENAYYIP